ncbi:serine-protein kinase RsbW [Peptoclostridium acidaminophilum DSM 3953]|uniref:Serine-protein kinase RsbW n=2 Tax=Peptoclostridium acidaminophilum TaxID=1731 RepID=W8T0W6_PEPAC|nr:ATP-binding protein [Peptoclostridium acidaminophilum]AHM55379.1 serine-protein kinase RsbW [Peptoclostridium acidaminophilum DSM 3953]
MDVIKNQTLDKELASEVDVISMTIPSRPEYVGVIRLTVSAIANRIGFNIEDIEDIKVAVAEACTNAIQHSYKNAKNFYVGFEVGIDSLGIIVKDEGTGIKVEDVKEPQLGELKEGGLGIFIIKSLMDEVSFSCEIEKGTEIKMVKFLHENY